MQSKNQFCPQYQQNKIGFSILLQIAIVIRPIDLPKHTSKVSLLDISKLESLPYSSLFYGIIIVAAPS